MPGAVGRDIVANQVEILAQAALETSDSTPCASITAKLTRSFGRISG